MKRLLFLIGLCCYSLSSHAQIETPLQITPEEEAQAIKETDSGKYYHASGNEENIIFLGEDPLTYRLLTKDRKVLVEGTLSSETDGFAREGRWTEFYKNGNPKITGYYYKNNPVGQWEKYYPTGKLMSAYTYALIYNEENFYCLVGSYRDYYENGQLKTDGLYKASIDNNAKDTIYVEDPITGQQIMKLMPTRRPKSEKMGVWQTYSATGELLKKEDNH